jgi:hypothetical protein
MLRTIGEQRATTQLERKKNKANEDLEKRRMEFLFYFWFPFYYLFFIFFGNILVFIFFNRKKKFTDVYGALSPKEASKRRKIRSL